MTVLDGLEGEAAMLHQYGSPEYDRELRKLKVLECRKRQDVRFCSSCPAYFDCELLKQFLRDVALGGSNEPGTSFGG